MQFFYVYSRSSLTHFEGTNWPGLEFHGFVVKAYIHKLTIQANKSNTAYINVYYMPSNIIITMNTG